MQADTSLAEEGAGGVMDEQPRDPAPQPEQPESASIPPGPEPEPSGWIPPAESKSNRIVIRVVAGIAVAVAAILVFTIFIGSQVGPREAAARDFGRRLMDMPEFQARYGDVDSPEQAYELGQTLGTTALARLDDPGLLRYWQLTEVLLQNADDSTCTQVMRQTIQSDQARELLMTLDEDQFKELLAVTFKAFEAELKGTPGPPPPSAAEVQAASMALADAMGLDAVTQAANDLQDATAEDAAVCGAARSFVRGVLDLEEPHRTTFLRYMVSQGV
jgi:hypothetical protein